jgi:hypothetical protein
MKKETLKAFLAWLAFFNWPPVLIWIPFLRFLCFFPFLFWLNIPGLWLGLAASIGKPHFEVHEFGAVPQTLLAWLVIVAFWTLLAAGCTVLTVIVRNATSSRGAAAATPEPSR